MNNGDPIGVAEIIENRLDGQRIVTPFVYTLDDVDVLTNTLIKRAIVKDIDGSKIATALELAHNKTIITARREVIVSAGSFPSPHMLMLSCLGSKTELQKHGIDVLLGISDIGLHLHDHISVLWWWKLKTPEKGLSVGSSFFNNLDYLKRNPMDFFTTQSVPTQSLLNALAADNDVDTEFLAVASQHSHHET